MPPRKRLPAALLVPLFVAAVAAVAHLGVLEVPFIYDDLTYVENNPLLRDPGGAGRLWVSAYPRGNVEQGLYRPLTATSFMLDHQLFGPDGRRFHVTNLLLHALATALFGLVMLRLGCGSAAAAVGALIFAVHPVHTEAVAWVVGRAEILAAVMCFATVLAWARFRSTDERSLASRGAWLGLAALCYGLGAFAKETAVPLPAVLLLGDVLGLFGRDGKGGEVSDGGPEGRPARRLVRSLLPYLALAAALAVYMALRLVALEGRLGVQENHRVFFSEPPGTRLATALAALGEVARLLVWPAGLRIDYNHLMSDRLLQWRTFLGLGVAVGAVAGAWASRVRAPQATLWIGWMVLILLPFTNLLIEIGTVLAERILYVPSAGACALAGLVAGRWLGPERAMWVRAATVTGTGVAVIVLTALTVDRVRDWQDAERFWRTAAAQSPNSEKVLVNLAGVLWDRGLAAGDERLLDESDAVLQAGLDLRPADTQGYTRTHLVMLLNRGHHLRHRRRWPEALGYSEQLVAALEQFPDFGFDQRAEAYVDYGATLRDLNRLDESVAAYRKALELRPDWVLAWEHLAYVYGLRRELEQVIECLRTIVRLDPTRRTAHRDLGKILTDLGRTEEAKVHLDAAERLAE